MITEELENRILSTMTTNKKELKMATLEELSELIQVITKSERISEFYINRITAKSFIEELINECADVLVMVIGLVNEYSIRGLTLDKIREICRRYEK